MRAAGHKTVQPMKLDGIIPTPMKHHRKGTRHCIAVTGVEIDVIPETMRP